MPDYVIKPASMLDIPILATMLGKRWDLNKSRTNLPEICNYLYALDCYAHSSILLKITEGGGTLGFTGVQIYGSWKCIIRRMLCKILFKSITLLQPKHIRDTIANYYKAYDYCPKELSKTFEACGAITIVGRDSKGKGLGRMLVSYREDLLRRMGIRNLRVDSDTASDYEFWIHMGFNVVYEKKDPYSGEPFRGNDVVYTFRKDL